MSQFAALQTRPYDLIIYGATGYLGSLIARYLIAHAPTTLSWAIAGRDESKLDQLLAELKTRVADHDRKPPGIIKASLNQDELNAMVSQGRVLLNTVGVRPSVPHPFKWQILLYLEIPQAKSEQDSSRKPAKKSKRWKCH
jgi:hypothetical protein